MSTASKPDVIRDVTITFLPYPSVLECARIVRSSFQDGSAITGQPPHFAISATQTTRLNVQNLPATTRATADPSKTKPCPILRTKWSCGRATTRKAGAVLSGGNPRSVVCGKPAGGGGKHSGAFGYSLFCCRRPVRV